MARRDSNPKQIFTDEHFAWLADWCAKYRKGTTDSDADYVAKHLGNSIGMSHPRLDLRAFLARAGVGRKSEPEDDYADRAEWKAHR